MLPHPQPQSLLQPNRRTGHKRPSRHHPSTRPARRLCAPLASPPLLFLALVHLARCAAAHSMMTSPTCFAPMTCRMGGEGDAGVEHCRGPCDLRAIRGGFARHGSPSDPARVVRRGERMVVKYQRNNHGPGGFNRLSFVPVGAMMDKAAHARHAFFYSCWGANPRVATPAETRADATGYSIAGNDGEQHGFPKAYYETTAIVPDCVPDGTYVLGWVWFGGIGAPVEGNVPTRPKNWGYFADYWSCSFVKVNGGNPLKSRCKVVFDNDMTQFSQQGCMAGNDEPGVCSWEPCKTTATFRKPKPFHGGRQPYIHAADYGVDVPPSGASAASAPATAAPVTAAPTTAAPATSVTPTVASGPRSAPAPTQPKPKKKPAAPHRKRSQRQQHHNKKKNKKPHKPRRHHHRHNRRRHRPRQSWRVEHQQRVACKCVAAGRRCQRWHARQSGWRCRARTTRRWQWRSCKRACCAVCRRRDVRRREWACRNWHVRRVCGWKW